MAHYITHKDAYLHVIYSMTFLVTLQKIVLQIIKLCLIKHLDAYFRVFLARSVHANKEWFCSSI